MLDELVDGEKYFENQENLSANECMKTYGSLILIEMGMVFRALYTQKGQAPSSAVMEDIENQKIDITMCLCILLAKSKSAKTLAID